MKSSNLPDHFKSPDIEAWVDYLNDNGYYATGPRVAIAKVIFDAGKIMTRDQVVKKARRYEPSISIETVSRTMKILKAGGFVTTETRILKVEDLVCAAN